MAFHFIPPAVRSLGMHAHIAMLELAQQVTQSGNDGRTESARAILLN